MIRFFSRIKCIYYNPVARIMLFFLILIVLLILNVQVIRLNYRSVSHAIEMIISMKPALLLDKFLGEGCFLVAILFAIGINFWFFKEPGFVVWKCSILKVVLGVIAGLLIGLAINLLQLRFLIYFHFFVSNNKETNFPVTPVIAYFLLLAFTEELVFRYYLFQTLEKHWGTSRALIVSSVVFAGMHLFNPGWASTFRNASYTILVTASAGSLFASCLILTRCMWMPITLHFSWNFFQTLIYGNALLGVAPWFGSFFDAEKADIFSAIFFLIPTIVITIFAIRIGHWQRFKGYSKPRTV